MQSRHAALVVALFAMFSAEAAVASCGSAFCLVNTNWGVQGVWNEPGLRSDFRFEYIDQDQLRNGTHEVSVGEIARHHDEVRTVNRNAFLTLDYGLSDDLGASLVVPWIDRTHDHIHNHQGQPIPEHWSFSRLGDMRATVRYQLPSGEHPDTLTLGFAGFTAGLKLPTGRHNVANEKGEVAERTLQPGTGTTDAVFGAYYRQALGAWNASWFVQANVQVPLNTVSGYRPGSQVLIDVGGRWEATDRLGVMLQANVNFKGRDSGPEAEPEDSGARTVVLSPGVTFAVTPGVQLYAFVQLPVYQHVNGVQLIATRSYAAGVNAQF